MGRCARLRRKIICRLMQQKLGGIPGIQMFPIMPEALPGADNFPVSFVFASTADPERILELAQQIFQKAMQAHMFQFRRHRHEDRSAAVQIVFDHDKVSRWDWTCRKLAADHVRQHRRQLRELVQHGRPQLQSDSADKTNRSIESRNRLKTFTSPGPNNQLIPLSTVASIRPTPWRVH